MKILLFLMFLSIGGHCQPFRYSVSNAHSHNDYKQAVPFVKAYQAGFGSIEVDIFLQNDQLLVGHDRSELNSSRTIENLYLQPLQNVVLQNKGFAYADTAKKMQLLIDIKTDSIYTLHELVKTLKKYATLITARNLSFVISGNRPAEKLFASYPSFISFDGDLRREYGKEALKRIVMMSDDLKNYTNWNGNGNIEEGHRMRLQRVVDKVHALGKPVRFWNAPDFESAWKQLMDLGVDFINTDNISAISSFLQTKVQRLPVTRKVSPKVQRNRGDT
jgi:alkaline phosphatase